MSNVFLQAYVEITSLLGNEIISLLAYLTQFKECLKHIFRYWIHNIYTYGLYERKPTIFEYVLLILKHKKVQVMYVLILNDFNVSL